MQILDNISNRPDDVLRMQASQVLETIAKAVNQRAARHAVHEPLMQIVDLLAAEPVDGQKMRAQLMVISDDVDTLKCYFKMLSTDEFKVLLSAWRSDNLDAARYVVSQGIDDGREQAVFALSCVHAAIGYEFVKRVPPGLMRWACDLESALAAWDMYAAQTLYVV